MSIRVHCPSCQHGFSIREEFAGKRGKCPKCAATVTIPAAGGSRPGGHAAPGHAPAHSRPSAPRIAAPVHHADEHDVQPLSGDAVHGGHHDAGELQFDLPRGGAAPRRAASRYGAAPTKQRTGVPIWIWILPLALALLAIPGVLAYALTSRYEKEEKRLVELAKGRDTFQLERLQKLREKADKAPKTTDVPKRITDAFQQPTIEHDLLPGIVRVINRRKHPFTGELVDAGSGSGFFVQSLTNPKEHWIVTNHHVVNGAEELKVRTYDPKTREIYDYPIAGFLIDKPKQDVCVIMPYQQIKEAKILPIQSTIASPKVGSRVYAAGSPGGHEFTIAEGIVTRNMGKKDLPWEANPEAARFFGYRLDPDEDVSIVEHDCRIFPGNSGGPLLNEDMQVIGINTWVSAAHPELARWHRGMLISYSMASHSWHLGGILKEITSDKPRPLTELEKESY